MACPGEAIIHCVSLRKTYGSVEALKGLNLTVYPHSIFGLLGPNGAGKSTTIKLLTRQIMPSGGQAWVAGAPITGHGADVRARIGYLSEQPSFYTWMSGQEFLDFTGELFGLSPTMRRRRRDELLELVGLADAGKRKIGGYSNGMRQRLGIAQALVNHPEVVFLDEPISALDPIGRKEILELLQQLKSETTVFFSSHVLADVDRICDAVAVLNQGELLAQASTAELKERYARPVITVELESDAENLRGLLAREPWVQHIAVSGTRASILVSDLAIAKRALPACLVNANLPLLRYEVALPTLEDVFIRLVGKEPDSVRSGAGETP
jgi:ABC-2 type transport system ATP-binding protein